jgi:SAM-dependent methyltransferase
MNSPSDWGNAAAPAPPDAGVPPHFGTSDPAVSAPFGAAMRAHAEHAWPQLLGLRAVDTGDTSWFNTDIWFSDTDPRHVAFCEAKRFIHSPVLDVGAGSGRAAMELQDEDHDVVAIDCEPGCVDVARARGVRNVELADISTYDPPRRFRTILFLDSTFGLTGDADAASLLLRHLATLLTEDGVVLVQDVDRFTPIHSFEGQFVFRNVAGRPFRWLSYSFGGLRTLAEKNGWVAERIVDGPGMLYVATLRPDASGIPKGRTDVSRFWKENWLIIAAIGLLLVLAAATVSN